MAESPLPPAQQPNLVVRFRKWVVWAVALGALLYVGGSVWAGFREVGDHLSSFSWVLYVPVLLLTLGNYGLRFVKWHYLMGVLGVKIPLREDATIFTAGFAMVISPGKAGELLKPYLVSRRTSVPMAVTVPALVAERLTDGIAMLALAALSIGTYAADKVAWVAIPAAVVLAGLGILASDSLSMTLLRALGHLPGVSKVAHKLEEMYRAMRRCLAPLPLLWTVALSVVAWWLECVGFLLVFRGLGIDASMEVCTFLYAFATVAGGAMPGGLGVADGALAGGAMTLLHTPESVAVAAALLIRVATLWFGVLLGALALFRFEGLLEKGIVEEGALPDGGGSVEGK